MMFVGSNGAPAKWNTTGGWLKRDKEHCCGRAEQREKERKTKRKKDEEVEEDEEEK